MELTLTGFLFGMALVGVPLYMALTQSTRLGRQMGRSLAFMAVALGVLGLCVWVVLTKTHWTVSLLLVLLMALGGAAVAVHRARVGLRDYYVPMAVGFVAALVVVLLWLWLLVVGLHHGFFAHYLVPLGGLLTGSMIVANGRALDAYYAGLRHRGQLYEYLLGNGGCHREATAYFVRRALQRGLVPMLKDMGTMVVLSVPVMMWALLMAGTSVWVAVGWQMVVLVAMLCCNVVSWMVAVWVARRYAFDAYEALKPQKPVVAEAPIVEPETPKTNPETPKTEPQTQANEADTENWLSMEV